MSKALKLIIGLGNPGQAYENTRHNVGQWCIQSIAQLAQTTPHFKLESKLKAKVAKSSVDNQTIILANPTTYMNESGLPTRAIAHFYKITPEEILVVHDELDIPPGDIRFKVGGGHGGHNGLRDIIQHLGTPQFVRLRIGVGKPSSKAEGRNFVLNPPNRHECGLIEDAIARACCTLPDAIAGRLDQAMLKLHSDK